MATVFRYLGYTQLFFLNLAQILQRGDIHYVAIWPIATPRTGIVDRETVCVVQFIEIAKMLFTYPLGTPDGPSCVFVSSSG